MFVQEVKGPALAIVVPLLARGLKKKQQAMKRKAATIINNMCQLVNDPSYVLPFIDRLIPGLERAEEEMTDENAKRVLKQTRELLLQNVVAAESFQPMESAQIEETLMATIKHDMFLFDSPQLANMVKYCAQETWLLVDLGFSSTGRTSRMRHGPLCSQTTSTASLVAQSRPSMHPR